MKKGDKIVALVVVSLLGISLLTAGLYRFLSRGEALIAKVTQNQKVIEVIDLNKVKESKEWTVKNEEGHFNTIRVEKGKIRFIDADCPDYVCVNSGWLSRSGDIAVCIPNKMSIHIEGKVDDIDQISY